MNNPVDFSRRSRRAILIFTGILLVVVLIPRMYYLLQSPPAFTFSQTDFQEQQYRDFKFEKREKKFRNDKKSRFSAPTSKFDPNAYAVSDWMLLGMSRKQAETILKFGKYGFYSDQDLRKVFVISDEFFAIIRDSLVYPVKPVYEKYEKKSGEPKAIVRIELNTASEEELMSIRGIGEFFAKNIVKKRTELGGFRNVSQLLEVWKFDQEKLDATAPFVSVDPGLVRTININTATAEELKAHPYISWNIANSIVKIRSQSGRYDKLEDLRRSALINDELLEKLRPYLSTE